MSLDNATYRGQSGLPPEQFDLEYMCRYNVGVNNRMSDERMRTPTPSPFAEAPTWQWEPQPSAGQGGGGGGDALGLIVLAGVVLCILVALWKILLASACAAATMLALLHGYDALLKKRGWRHPADAAGDAAADFAARARRLPGLGWRAMRWAHAQSGRGLRRARRLGAAAAQVWGERAQVAAARTRHALMVFDSRPRSAGPAAWRSIAAAAGQARLQLQAAALERLAAALGAR